MKKLRLTSFTLLLCLILSLLCACGDASPDPISQSETPIYTPGPNDTYTIVLPASGKSVLLNEWHAPYLPYLDGDAIREAERSIFAQYEALKTDDSPVFYVTCDQEGYLCLAVEIIVSLEHNDEMLGCGLDHDHVFFSERISSHAFTYEELWNLSRK